MLSRVPRIAGLGATLLVVAGPALRRLAARRLAWRVRRRVAPLLARPQELQVEVAGGRVVLSGPVRPRELDPLLSSVWQIRAVRHVDVRLELEDTATASGRSPGDAPPARPTLPVFRMVAVLSGGGMAALALQRVGRARTVLSLGSALLLGGALLDGIRRRRGW